MRDKEGVRIVFAGLFNELVQNRRPDNGDELRLCWREAVEGTCQQFVEWGAKIGTQRIYALVDDFLRDVRSMASSDQKVDWRTEGF